MRAIVTAIVFFKQRTICITNELCGNLANHAIVLIPLLSSNEVETVQADSLLNLTG